MTAPDTDMRLIEMFEEREALGQDPAPDRYRGLWDIIGGAATIIANIYSLTSAGAGTSEQIRLMQLTYRSLLDDIKALKGSLDHINATLAKMPEIFGKVVEKQLALDRLAEAEVISRQIGSRMTSQEAIVANRHLLNDLIAQGERSLLLYIEKFDPETKAPFAVVPAASPLLGVIGQAHTVVQRALFVAEGQNPEFAPTIYDMEVHHQLKQRIGAIINEADGLRAKHNAVWEKTYPSANDCCTFTKAEGFRKTGRKANACDPNMALLCSGVAPEGPVTGNAVVAAFLPNERYDPDRPCGGHNSIFKPLIIQEDRPLNVIQREMLERHFPDALHIPDYIIGWSQMSREAGYLRSSWHNFLQLKSNYLNYMSRLSWADR